MGDLADIEKQVGEQPWTDHVRSTGDGRCRRRERRCSVSARLPRGGRAIPSPPNPGPMTAVPALFPSRRRTGWTASPDLCRSPRGSPWSGPRSHGVLALECDAAAQRPTASHSVRVRPGCAHPRLLSGPLLAPIHAGGHRRMRGSHANSRSSSGVVLHLAVSQAVTGSSGTLSSRSQSEWPSALGPLGSGRMSRLVRATQCFSSFG